MYIMKDRIRKGGRLLTPANIHIECTAEQIEQLIKNKSIKKENKDGKGGSSKKANKVR